MEPEADVCVPATMTINVCRLRGWLLRQEMLFLSVDGVELIKIVRG